MIARKRIEPDRVGGIAVGLGLGMLAHFTFDALGLAPQLADHAWPIEIACRSGQALIVWVILLRIVHASSSGARPPVTLERPRATQAA